MVNYNELRDSQEFYANGYKKGYEDAKKEFARPTGEWISVSERLPEYSGLYIVSVDDVVLTANFDGKYFSHICGGLMQVYAWMPFPQPYKPIGED